MSYLIVRVNYLPSHLPFSNCPAKSAVYVLVPICTCKHAMYIDIGTYYVLQRVEC